MREAADAAAVVVLALPWTEAAEAVPTLGPLAGKIVIECMNSLALRDGVLLLERGFATSAGETVAEWLPAARVVKTLNQVGAAVMADTSGFATPPVMFMASDHAEAKTTVAGLLADLGFEPLDAGNLIQARYLEPYAMVWINQSLYQGKRAPLGIRCPHPRGAIRLALRTEHRERRTRQQRLLRHAHCPDRNRALLGADAPFPSDGRLVRGRVELHACEA